VTTVRWGRAEMTGTLAAKVRWGRAEMAGTADTVVLPFTPVTCEAEEIVPLAAVLSSGGTADVYTWRRVSGPAVVISGSGASVTVKAPSAMPPGAVVVIGVTATKDSVASSERTVTLTVYPQLEWSRVYPATAWTGAPLTV
jgi:hypothetical protein